MFRSALIRSAAAVSRVPVTRVARVPISRAAAPRAIVYTPAVSRVRMYSAAAGLKKDEVEGRIIGVLQGFDKVNSAENITPTSHFANDLGLDSLDTVEVVMAIEEEFSIEIPDKDADGIHSVEKAVEYILNQPDAN